VRQLILPHRHQVPLAEQDVGRLVRRVGEHQAAHRRLPRMRDLVLHCRVAPKFGHRDQAEEWQQQLVQLGDRAVREDDRARRVDPDREVIEDKPVDPLAEPLGDVPVGERLVVGDEDEHRGPGVLQPHPVAQAAEVMPQVQVAGGPVAGEDTERVRIFADPPLEFRRAAQRRGEASRDSGGDLRRLGERACHGLLPCQVREARDSQGKRKAVPLRRTAVGLAHAQLGSRPCRGRHQP
jgi:hypothetical protein